MAVKNIIYGFCYWGTIISFLINLAACVPANTNSPEDNVENELIVATLEVAMLPTSMPRPQFIRAVSPVESAALPIHLYRSATDANVVGVKGYPIGFPDPQQGYNSRVCVELDFAPPVAQQGDALTDRNTLSRLFVFVDGQNRTLIYDIYIKTGLEKNYYFQRWADPMGQPVDILLGSRT